MQLAGQEAASAEFKEIEPEHLLEAVLKFSELDPKQVASLAADDSASAAVQAELAVLRRELEQFSIDTTRLRRKLRKALGRGTVPFAGGQIHRSTASREVFDLAATRARTNGCDQLTVPFLLKALLESPTDLIQKTFGKTGETPLSTAPECPLLNQHGKLLSGESSGSDTNPPKPLASVKALVQALSSKGCRCVFLVTQSDHLACDVIVQMAHTITVSPDSPAGRGKSVYSLASLPINMGALKVWGRLFEEARNQKVILFLPAIDGQSERDLWPRWLETVKRAIADSAFQCITRVTPSAYETFIERDPALKRVSRLIWLQESGKNSLPDEL